MTDHAPHVAAFLVERPAGGAESAALWAEMRRRWPGLTPEEGRRGARIASEILAGTVAENLAALDVMEAALAPGDGPPSADEPQEDDDADRDR